MWVLCGVGSLGEDLLREGTLLLLVPAQGRRNTVSLAHGALRTPILLTLAVHSTALDAQAPGVKFSVDESALLHHGAHIASALSVFTAALVPLPRHLQPVVETSLAIALLLFTGKFLL